MQHFSLDQLIDADHRVRYVWQYVQSLDLSSLYDQIKATEAHAGRPPIDPQILFALWLFATIEGSVHAHVLGNAIVSDERFVQALVDALIRVALPPRFVLPAAAGHAPLHPDAPGSTP